MKNIYLKDINDLEYNYNKSDLENKFIIKTDNDNYRYFDLTEAIKVRFSDKTKDIYCLRYNPKKTDTWIYLAYKFYNNSRLWYVIPIINNIHDIVTTVPSDYKELLVLKNKYLFEITK